MTEESSSTHASRQHAAGGTVIRTVGWLISNARTLDRCTLACLSPSPLSVGDPCVVVDSRDLDEGEDVPRIAADLGLVRTLSARSLLGVVDNLRLQTPDPTEQEGLEALDHYMHADAYISFESD
jgi:hypothetical protein